MLTDFSEYSTPHAIVRLWGDRTYGHIDASVRHIDEGNYRSPRLRISCQIGSNENDAVGISQRQKTYAWNYGISGGREEMTLDELEIGVKIMRRINRKLNQMDEELGLPETFAEYCARILIASGVNYAFVNEAWGGPHCNPIYLPMAELKTSAGKSKLREMLGELEKRLVAYYNLVAKAA